MNRQAPPTADEKQLATALQGLPGCSQIGGLTERDIARANAIEEALQS